MVCKVVVRNSSLRVKEHILIANAIFRHLYATFQLGVDIFRHCRKCRINHYNSSYTGKM